jgi:drug/metabolite transporter (DMT)-like permease
MIISSLIWLPAALFGGLFQAWRTAIQQRLRGELSVSGAGLVRYLFGAPVAIILATVWLLSRHLSLPAIDSTFMIFATFAGLAQILATNLLIMAFGYRNFVVGTAFSKTEAVQVAMFAWVFLGEGLGMLAIISVVLSMVGVLLLALGGKNLSRHDVLGALAQPAALCGMGAGALFAFTGILVKRATLHLDMTDSIGAALITLTVVMVMQVLMHGGYVLLTERATFTKIFTNWRVASQVGLLAALGSACWFTGFANAPVALVRVVGNVEVLFTIAFAWYYLKEKTKPHEIAGLLLVAAGVILALISGLGLH